MKINYFLVFALLQSASFALVMDHIETIKVKEGEPVVIKLFEGGHLMTKWTCTKHDAAALGSGESTYTHSTISGAERDGGRCLTLTYKALKKGETCLTYICKSQATQQQLAEKQYKITIE